MLDGCEDVSDIEFEHSVNFTCSMANQCNISQHKTQVGCSVYSNETEFEYEFYNTSSYDDFSSSLYDIDRPERKRF